MHFLHVVLVLGTFLPCVDVLLFGTLPSVQCPRKRCSVTLDSDGSYIFECEYAECEEVPLELGKISRLSMKGNFIKSVPPLPYASLKVLDLSNNNITTLEADALVQLTSLETLNLEENKLSSVQAKNFEGLNSLTHLFLNGNLLSRLDSGVFFFVEDHLQKLDVSYNKISSIGRDAFAMMFDLTTLYLKGNQLDAITQGTFFGLPDAKRIDLQENFISEIPPNAFGSCHKLRYLTLSYNNISRLYNDSFLGLDGLVMLDMHSNSLTEFEADSFRRLVSIEELYLDRNPLVTLEGDILPKNLRRISITAMPRLKSVGHRVFVDMPNLIRVSLKQNSQLETIHEAAFSYNGTAVTLAELDLSFNRLSVLYRNLVPWRQLTFLDLSGNPWHCDCRIEWMKEVYMASENRLRTICATPEKFDGYSIAELDFDDFQCDGGSRYRTAFATCLIVFITLGLAIGVVFIACKAKNRQEYRSHSTPWRLWQKKQKGYDVMYNSADADEITAAVTILNEANEKRYLKSQPAPTPV